MIECKYEGSNGDNDDDDNEDGEPNTVVCEVSAQATVSEYRFSCPLSTNGSINCSWTDLESELPGVRGVSGMSGSLHDSQAWPSGSTVSLLLPTPHPSRPQSVWPRT